MEGPSGSTATLVNPRIQRTRPSKEPSPLVPRDPERKREGEASSPFSLGSAGQSCPERGTRRTSPVTQASARDHGGWNRKRKNPGSNGGGGVLSMAGENPSQYRRWDLNPHSLAATGF